MKNLYKIVFTTTMIIGTTMTISSNTWMGMWLGLEINLLSIIPLMSNVKNKLESETSMKYFIIQAMASTIFLLSIILMMLKSSLSMKAMKSLILDSAILTKMGAAPFHFWFPEVMEGLSWTNSAIMLTWQKIAPMIIFSYSNKPIMFISSIIITSMIISGIMGINQTSMRKILAYSSINHIGWMLATMLTNQSIWITYLIIYSLMTINMTLMFKNLNIFFIKQLMNSLMNNKKLKTLFAMNFLSLGGIPPLVGFFPKWITINFMISEKMFTLTVIMILMTLMTLFFYMQITFSSIILKMTESKLLKQNNTNKTMILTLNFITLSSLSMCMLIFNFI